MPSDKSINAVFSSMRQRVILVHGNYASDNSGGFDIQDNRKEWAWAGN